MTTDSPFLRKHAVGGVEHRQDPLFRTWSRINPERARRPKQTGGTNREADLKRLVETSRRGCPFCLEHRDAETPVFPADLFPTPRLLRGEQVLFPNKSPYGEHHGVGILSDAHFIPMEAYTEDRLLDSLTLTQDYFRAVRGKDPAARYPVYVWNFLPPSAGSIVHPHVQVLLERRPAPIIETLVERSRAWRARMREDFWDRLLREERARSERLVHEEAGLTILATFAPRGFREILILLPGSGSLAELEAERTRQFARALTVLLRAYHAMGVGSFNLVTYSPPMAEEPPPFPFHAKLISRPYPSGIYTNDTGFFERMYDLWIIDTMPEDVAAETRAFFPP